MGSDSRLGNCGIRDRNGTTRVPETPELVRELFPRIVPTLSRPRLKTRHGYPSGSLRLDMACKNQNTSENHSEISQHDYISSDSDEDDIYSSSTSQEVRSGIDIEAIKSARRVEHTIAHCVGAARSILALVVDDDYLIAGLEGGDIVVCGSCSSFDPTKGSQITPC
jgi:hypothetical protein